MNNDLAARLEQLEHRQAELEAQVQQLQAKRAGPTDADLALLSDLGDLLGPGGTFTASELPALKHPALMHPQAIGRFLARCEGVVVAQGALTRVCRDNRGVVWCFL